MITRWDGEVKVRTGGCGMGWVRLIVYRRAGVSEQERRGRLLVAVLFADPSFSGSVRGSVVGFDGRRCFAIRLLLLSFYTLGFGLVLQFPVLPLGGQRRRGRGVGCQEVKRVGNSWRREEEKKILSTKQHNHHDSLEAKLPQQH